MLMIEIEREERDMTDTVSKALSCPNCHENNFDNLEILHDETIRCSTCGEVYDPTVT